ncbi:zinc iron transporter [Pyrenophora seminiperda CCB06]|uniref:Zinc iron transporter n=1 Tax=Pyrenophora seminiperda CCB06 TaxID=1302712 RepID=A0A3M7MGG0_9PLEO|nr:zinc iron transporter [Pyrenophora seminiperda CCB06]
MSVVAAQTVSVTSGVRQTAAVTATSFTPSITAVSGCHAHKTALFCLAGSEEYQVSGPTATEQFQAQYTDCHMHGPSTALGVYTPLLTQRFNLVGSNALLFVLFKQFGTGIIISTAFIHLFTHATLMYGNSCLGELQYEGTVAAIFMAGLFLSFLIDYLGVRFVGWRQGRQGGSGQVAAAAAGEGAAEKESNPTTPDAEANYGNAGVLHAHSHSHSHGPAVREIKPLEAKINVLNLEAGIIFHSILIGITLVVAGDSFFLTLFVVILFHQLFEGIALGTCIAELPPLAASTLQKMLMGGAFALITPIGMAIGIGVLNRFNGNDKSTIVAIGTLDALSAGILAWVGIVEMLAADWMQGRLRGAGVGRTLAAMGALVSGMVVMSVLGKWA